MFLNVCMKEVLWFVILVLNVKLKLKCCVVCFGLWKFVVFFYVMGNFLLFILFILCICKECVYVSYVIIKL